MAKETLSARELADKIRERLDESDLRVAVYSDADQGWRAVAYSDPATVSAKQVRVDGAVRKLRAAYDLKE
jgi:hypothetical protein